MSFQKKYWYTFKSLKQESFNVEIWQDTVTTITAQEIRGDLNPFLIQYSDVSKFEVVRGSGCELNLLSETDRQFFGLYSADMMEYQIKVFEGLNLIWMGYLDSELYTEPFNEIKNYPVKFSGTDGFALLQRMNYLDADGNKYSGLVTKISVIKNIISKLNLVYNNIYISVSTTSNNFSIPLGETIFHKTFCNNQNWYNEDGDPETCRNVLEHILKPYGCFIIQDNANLFIVDVNTIAKGITTSFKRFDNSFNFVSIVNLNLNLGDISNIKFAESNQQLNVVSGFNKQVIKYSPYAEPKIIDYVAEDDIFSGTTLTTQYGLYPYRYIETTYTTSKDWLCNTDTGSRFAELKGMENNENENEKYLVHAGFDFLSGQDVSRFTWIKPVNYLIPSTNHYLKLDAKAYCVTTNNLGEPAPENGLDIRRLELKVKLSIGNKFFNGDKLGANYGWGGDTYLILTFTQATKNTNQLYTESNIANKWTNLTETRLYLSSPVKPLYIPLNISGNTGNNLQFTIYGYQCFDKNNLDISGSVFDLRLKDFKFSIVDNNFIDIEKSDVEYIGYMNAKFKNESDEITIYNGTSNTKSPIEKGALLGYSGTNFYYLDSWTREGKTDILENLLLRSIVSNYTNKTIELTCTTNKISSIIGVLKYQLFLPDKVFMIVGCTQNLSDSSTNLNLQEIEIDNLDINKSFS